LLGEDYKHLKNFAPITVVLLSQITPQKWTDVFFINTSISLASQEDKRGAYRVLAQTPEGKTQPGRPRHKWEDNIKMYLQEVGWGSMDWIDLAQDRDRWQALVNVVMHLRVS
jgi:hypothetical protein